MRVFLLAPEESVLPPEALFSPGEERARYLLQVLRLPQGSLIPGMGRGGELRPLVLETTDPCTIRILPEHHLSPEQFNLLYRELPAQAVQQERTDGAEARNDVWDDARNEEVKVRAIPGEVPPVTLVQALLKGKKMDQVIRQATELGVARIIPVHSSRSVPHFSGKDGEKKAQRWRTIVREAVQQSGSSIITEVATPVPLEEAIQGMDRVPTLKLFFHERPLAQLSLHRYLSQVPVQVTVAIGPEGGFGPGDVELFASGGFQGVTLAGTILRAETAAVAALAIVKTLLSEQGEWRLRDE